MDGAFRRSTTKRDTTSSRFPDLASILRTTAAAVAIGGSILLPSLANAQSNSGDNSTLTDKLPTTIKPLYDEKAIPLDPSLLLLPKPINFGQRTPPWSTPFVPYNNFSNPPHVQSIEMKPLTGQWQASTSILPANARIEFLGFQYRPGTKFVTFRPDDFQYLQPEINFAHGVEFELKLFDKHF